jgi:hypothetical protein
MSAARRKAKSPKIIFVELVNRRKPFLIGA